VRTVINQAKMQAISISHLTLVKIE